MTKETKWLLIFGGIFLVIGIIGSLLISMYSNNISRQKELKDYEQLFPKVASVVEVEDFDKNDVVIKKEEVLDKKKDLLGYAYTATITVENTIPNTTTAELKLLVGIDKNNKVTGIITLLREHTPGFYDKYEEKYLNINGISVDKLNIDTIAGSTISAGIINDILTEVKKAHLGIKLSPYEEIFGEGVVAQPVSGFVGNEIVTKKLEIYDEDENLLGYVYEGTVLDTVLFEEYDKKGDLTLLVGVDKNLKIVGIAELINTHTGGYYRNYNDALNSLSGKPVDDLGVDSVAGSTKSGEALNEIFAAIKEVISNE